MGAWGREVRARLSATLVFTRTMDLALTLLEPRAAWFYRILLGSKWHRHVSLGFHAMAGRCFTGNIFSSPRDFAAGSATDRLGFITRLSARRGHPAIGFQSLTGPRPFPATSFFYLEFAWASSPVVQGRGPLDCASFGSCGPSLPSLSPSPICKNHIKKPIFKIIYLTCEAACFILALLADSQYSTVTKPSKKGHTTSGRIGLRAMQQGRSLADLPHGFYEGWLSPF